MRWLPIVVTTTARDSMWGPTFPELVEALAGVQIIDRGSVNAFDDAPTAHAIEATGRKKLIFAGLSLEVCAAFPAITAISRGLDGYVAVDACGTFNDTKRQLGIARLMQAGVVVSDYATLMMEVMKDNNRPEAGAVYGAIDMDWAKLVGQLAHSYGKSLPYNVDTWMRVHGGGARSAAPAHRPRSLRAVRPGPCRSWSARARRICP